MLSPEEYKAKQLLVNAFLPALHQYLKRHNLEEYNSWQGNACRQTAIIGARFCLDLLQGYRIQVFEGVFIDIVRGVPVAYDHAWIYAKKDGRKLLIDLARNYRERLFIEVSINQYPKDHPEYQYQKEVSRKELDWEQMLCETEYYTKETGEAIYQALKGVVYGHMPRM